MIPTLAILFVTFLIGMIFYGFGIIMRRLPTNEELRSEKCSLCGNRFQKEDLIERAVGDSKLYFFCQSCIMTLYGEMQSKDVVTAIHSKRLRSEVDSKKN